MVTWLIFHVLQLSNVAVRLIHVGCSARIRLLVESIDLAWIGTTSCSRYTLKYPGVLCVIPFFVLIVVCGTLFQEHTDDVWMIRMFLHRTATNRADSNLGKDLWLTSTPRLGYQEPMVIVLLNLAAECYKVSAPRFG
ncbi:hypothetical protein OUZ56_030053 [Daphnia magna]|uniref:Uncharacterized protein n=1 Tax=Daphnia magna TaxID=35525 RepID=A0ABQ9ZQ53_9CRUS|nr:hypothetical protein OUZ56_030053 [Daphnia magna]